MPRKYIPDPRGKKYKKYDENVIKEAVEEYRTHKISLKEVAEKYNIDKSVLYRHSTRTMRKHGGQTVLSEETEEYIIIYINICADWGYPLDSLDLRFLIKYYLDKLGRTELKFKNNLPGPDFVAGFLKRHKDKISQRNCQNIKKNRAAVSPDSIKDYFKELEVSLSDIEPGNILNYDETNLTDDPGRKKIITKRGTKYPERVMNHSKASISVMISATADGALLPPYVVYKAQNFYDTWTENGPPGTRYNRSQSGWFDANIFEDWIKTIVLPYFRDNEGKKCLIGDNLSSHLSLDVIKQCHEQNISFVFLPANSTHVTQPLDVAFFQPMKIAWRNILLKWKKSDGKTQASVPKGCFPSLLNKLIEDLRKNSKDNILAGFRKTGINPIDQNQVLSRLPEENEVEKNEDAVEKSVLDILKEMRYGTMNIKEPKRKRKLDVIPGRSVGTESEDYVETAEEDLQRNAHKTTALRRIINVNSKVQQEVRGKEGKKLEKGNGGKKTKKQDQQTNEKENEKEVTNEEQNIALNEKHNLDCAGIDLEAIPIVYEDILLYGDEVVAENVIHHDQGRDEIQNLQHNSQKAEEKFLDFYISKRLEEVDNNMQKAEASKHFQKINEICYTDHTLKDVREDMVPNTLLSSTNYRDNYEKEKGNLEIEKRDKDLKSKKKGVHANKIKIVANEELSDITMRSKVVTLNICTKISAKTRLKVSETRFVEDQPSTSTSDSQTISTRRPLYYRNEVDIIRDLMDDNV